MSNEAITRRELLSTSVMAGGALLTGGLAAGRARNEKLHVACNQYPWIVFYQREGKDFGGSLDSGLGELASCNLDGFEPILNTPQDVDRLAPLLEKHGLEMRSFYVNSTLHDPAKVDDSIRSILAVSEKARQIGTKIVVTNPSPIRWGGPEDKDDAHLRTQAEAMNRLGAELRSLGLTLSYHNHDIELRQAAREFHHMMVGTDPENVTLCLDAHWVYRGAGNSTVALFDVLKLYGSRISELHLRQSKDGVWTETFDEGDIDYNVVVQHLLRIGVNPHLVLEQAAEEGTPKTLSTVEAFMRSSRHVRSLFAGFA